MIPDENPDAVTLALAYCTCCSKAKQRIKLRGIWVCTVCDRTWDMPVMRKITEGLG